MKNEMASMSDKRLRNIEHMKLQKAFLDYCRRNYYEIIWDVTALGDLGNHYYIASRAFFCFVDFDIREKQVLQCIGQRLSSVLE